MYFYLRVLRVVCVYDDTSMKRSTMRVQCGTSTERCEWRRVSATSSETYCGQCATHFFRPSTRRTQRRLSGQTKDSTQQIQATVYTATTFIMVRNFPNTQNPFGIIKPYRRGYIYRAKMNRLILNKILAVIYVT
jgi:hypothetical protein